MNVKETLKVGSLILILLVSGVIYIQMNDLKMRIDFDKTTFYTYDKGWTVSGREYNRLFDGNKRVYRDVSEITIDKELDGNNIIIKRKTQHNMSKPMKSRLRTESLWGND